ncbi:hypothetical protein ACFYU5_33455 [Nocardia aobensis]|uniref:Uncharacterized protein n=1 Tax=Nocardia aobensis TaxID=257277 RepID=A0ABW6PE06_9NOCA
MNDPSNSRSQRGPDAGEFAARLHHSRSVMDRRRALERRREQAVTDAVRDYWSAWQAISMIEQRRDRRIQTLRDKINSISEAAAADIAVHQENQAEAAKRMNEHGCSTDDIAELLEISTRTARQLLASSRARTERPEQTPKHGSGRSFAEPQPASESAGRSSQAEPEK